jgi:hypothetical protein
MPWISEETFDSGVYIMMAVWILFCLYGLVVVFLRERRRRQFYAGLDRRFTTRTHKEE